MAVILRADRVEPQGVHACFESPDTSSSSYRFRSPTQPGGRISDRRRRSTSNARGRRSLPAGPIRSPSACRTKRCPRGDIRSASFCTATAARARRWCSSSDGCSRPTFSWRHRDTSGAGTSAARRARRRTFRWSPSWSNEFRSTTTSTPRRSESWGFRTGPLSRMRCWSRTTTRASIPSARSSPTSQTSSTEVATSTRRAMGPRPRRPSVDTTPSSFH